MSNYTTISEKADVMQNKTNAFKIIAVSDDVDLGYFWQKSGGSAVGKLKVTVVKPDGSRIVKTATAGEVGLVNTKPPTIKVLLLASANDLDQKGNYLAYPEFMIDDSWIQSDRVAFTVVDDPISTD